MAISCKGRAMADMANGPTRRESPFPDMIEVIEGLDSTNDCNGLP